VKTSDDLNRTASLEPALRVAPLEISQ